MGCCDKDNEQRSGGDCRLITAQSFAIAAFVVSVATIGYESVFWFYSVDFGLALMMLALVINIVGLVLFQIPWCCRQGRCFLYTAGGFAVFLSLGMLALGITMVFYFYVPLVCAFAVVGGILWATAATLTFVCVGSYAESEQAQQPNNSGDVELELVEQQQASTVAIASGKAVES